MPRRRLAANSRPCSRHTRSNNAAVADQLRIATITAFAAGTAGGAGAADATA